MIFIAKNQVSIASDGCHFTAVKSLGAPYPDIKAIVVEHGTFLRKSAISGAHWRLANSGRASIMASMDERCVPLGEYVGKDIFYGIKTGFNEAFVIDGCTRNRLIAESKTSRRLIKPLAVGDDVRKWKIDQKERWLIVTPNRNSRSSEYPAIYEAPQALPRPNLNSAPGPRDHWWELRACTYYKRVRSARKSYFRR